MADPVTIAAVGWGIAAVGWLVSPIITRLLNKAFSYLGVDGAKKLKELETKVLQLELLMEAVEESPRRNQLERLFQDLRSAFYEAEDILDDVEYCSLERQALSLSHPGDKLDSQSMPSSGKNWVSKIHSALPKTSRLKIQVNGATSNGPPLRVSKMELSKILEKIENIVTEAHKILQLLNLPSGSNVDKRQIVAENSRGAVTTVAPPRLVIGRDEDRVKVISMLRETLDDGQRDRSGAKPYSTIGIYGVPGSGKSTLAQYVCAHEEDTIHFDIVIWVHVSQKFSVQAVLREMIEQQILSPLNVAKAGRSKILATSRTLDALLALGATRRIPIRDLDDGAFLNLFMHYTLDFASIDERDRGEFQMVGAEIAKKLKRSPLAARTVGRQLCIRPNVEFWRSTRDRDLLDETMGALWWSYQHLDEQVRRCFSYCSIFPRRRWLDPEYLVRLWVAEGFVTSRNTGEELEAVGRGYFDELVSASFLQPVDGDKERYTIHDLLRDLVSKVAGSDCFRADNGWEGEFPQDVRHLSVENRKLDLIAHKITRLKKLCTLIISAGENDTPVEEKALLETIFTGVTTLRVLQITPWTAGTLSFPASVGRLKHLRYISVGRHIGGTKVILPSTVLGLYHLQLLDCPSVAFSSCEDIVKLVSLRHLLCSSGSLNVPNVGRIVSLRTLRCFRVKKKAGYELWQLKHLNKLEKKLVIRGLQNAGGKGEALEANLAAKERLTSLALEWDSDALLSCGADLQAEVLEGLCPPLHLEKLRLCWYGGSRYPDWIVGVRCLCLYRCSRLGAFHGWRELSPRLVKLKILECGWDALPDNMEHLASLRKLVIDGCKDLRSLPELPRSLLHLKISGCDGEVMRSCKTVGHPNRKRIQHVRTVIIGWESLPRAELLDHFESEPVVPEKEKEIAALVKKLLVMLGLLLLCMFSVIARLLVGSFLLPAPLVVVILLLVVWIILTL
ncbi:putative disease resistance protein RGA4 [Zea mays]|uniref:Putative disease resistance protein RGA4 n=1 Tax=Zea mays TaxID=4577 RepID=A0A3L6FA16_MAIZE|nr:putative disease resistance protein RGA4 [Zea mays]